MSPIARATSNLSSSTSESPGKRSYESQSPWSAKAQKDDRTGELELSLGSRSFLDRVNDQVRKRQKRSSMNVTENDEKHSLIWGMFMSVSLQSSVFMVKNYSDNWHSIKNAKELTMKQMFDISAKLVSAQDEIYGLKTVDLEKYSWKYLSLIGDGRIISLQRTKVYVFSDSVLCLGKIHENTSNQTMHGNKDWSGSKHLRNTETLTELTVSQWNSSGIFSQDSLQLSQEVKDLLLRLDETPENFTGRIIFMSMFNDISWRSRDIEKECESNARLVSLYARRFGTGQGSFLGPGSEKKWYSISADSPQGEWDRMAEKMMLEFGESGHPVFRATSPLSRVENCRYTIVPIWIRLKLFFASSVFTEQSQKCVKNTKPLMIERRNPLSEGSRVPHSCQE